MRTHDPLWIRPLSVGKTDKSTMNWGAADSIVLPENRGEIFQQRRNILLEHLSSKEFRAATDFSSFRIHPLTEA